MIKQPNKFNTKYKEFFPTEEEWNALHRKYKIRGASVHETMGPNWKDIYWTPHPININKRPYVITGEF